MGKQKVNHPRKTHSTLTLSKLTHSSHHTDTGRSCRCTWHRRQRQQCHLSLGAQRSPSITCGPLSHHRTGQEPQSCGPRKPKPHGLPVYQLSSPSLPNCPQPAFKLKPHAVSETSLRTEGLQPGNCSPAQLSPTGATHKAGSRAQHHLSRGRQPARHHQPAAARSRVTAGTHPLAPQLLRTRFLGPSSAARHSAALPRLTHCRLRLLPPCPPEVEEFPPRGGCGSPRDEERAAAPPARTRCACNASASRGRRCRTRPVHGPVHTLAPGLPGTRTKPEPMEPQLEESAFSSHLWQPLTSPHRLCLLSEPRPGPVRIRLSVDPQGIISATPLLVQWALQTPRPEHPAASGVIR